MTSRRLPKASACIAPVAGVVSAGLVSIALLLPVSAPTITAQPARAVTGASAELQDQLNGLASTVVGPDRAVVTASVGLDQRGTRQRALSYGKRATTLQSSVAATSAAGYRQRTASTVGGHNEKLVTTTGAPGATTRVDLAVMVDARVPPKTVKALKRVLGTAAGLRRSRGDRISITRTRFPTATPSAASPLANAHVRSLLGSARWVLLGAGVLGFAWRSTLELVRHPLNV
jgi:flagellar biosynthesis/type III secretory pathway M-ring protein FliF/YscJ